MKQDLAFPRFSRQTGFLHEESLFSDLCLSQRRKGAKRYRVFKGFLCAFASLRETVFPQMYFSCKASQTLIRPSLLLLQLTSKSLFPVNDIVFATSWVDERRRHAAFEAFILPFQIEVTSVSAEKQVTRQ